MAARLPSGAAALGPGALRCGALSLTILIAGHGAVARADAPASAEFDAGFLHGTGGAQVDLARFARGNPVLPGAYLVDLTVNGRLIGRERVVFRAVGPDADARPCLDRDLLGKVGLDYTAIARETRLRIATLTGGLCIDPAEISPEFGVSFDQSRLALALLVPQALLRRQARNFVAPELWDRGVPSATLRYDADFYHTDTPSGPRNSGYLRLDAGVNLGTWHFRQRSAATVGSDGSRFDNVATYVVHDIPAITSRLTLGDSYTDGTIFDSLGLRGIALGTDDRMRPDSRSGYAPTVRGIARTVARVRISQNGVLLLETTVSPGPFTIDDLYPTGYGGDLQVEVLEADGTRQAFAVPFAAVPQMLRPGVLRYAVAGGEFRDNGLGTGESFGQATIQYGISNRFTGYVGMQLADGYLASLLGVAWNSPVGAMAFDATVARSELPGGEQISGYSLRASLAKTIAASRTNLTFAALRYSSDGYVALADFLRQRAGRPSGARQRERLQVNVSQDLPDNLGALYLSGSVTRFWEQSGSVTQLQAGYNKVVPLGRNRVNLGLSYAQQRNLETGQRDNRLLLSVSLGLNGKAGAPQLSASLVRTDTADQASTGGQISVSGALGQVPRLTYNLVATSMPDFDGLSLNLGYRGKRTSLKGSASTGTGFHQLSLGLSGGIVIHKGGITLSNQLDDTVAIVSAPGAAGARIGNGSDGELDGQGYGIVPYLRPYRSNEVAIDPEGLPDTVDFASTSREVAPRADTVVLVKFGTTVGQAVLLRLSRADGSPVPFGASIRDATGGEVAVAGQDGQVYLRTAAPTGALQARWSDAPDGGCSFRFELPRAASGQTALVELAATCLAAVPEIAR